MKTLRKIHNTLTVELERIQMHIEHRETVFDNRSGKWQWSERGDAHFEKTESLQCICNDLENAIDELEDLLEN